MAFGLGFNKAKVLSSAEKYVQQGKLQNAIAEYQKVLKNDPKDLTVLNTVGDLFARLGQSEEACNCFKNVGDAYAQQGFTVKAIAMYKKLTKIKSSLEGTLKLAELYTQQGLFNDARQQYLQVAEEFLRTGQLEQAVRIFQKTLEMDPENVAMKVRLAEVYLRLGKKDDAWQIFAGAAEQLRSRGQLAPAEDILQRMLTLDPQNSKALLLRGRNSLDAGDSAAAIHHLEKIPNIDSQPEGLKLLFQARLAAEQLSEAGALATKLLTLHNDLSGITSFVDALLKAGLYEDALKVINQYAEPLIAADKDKTLNDLHSIIGHVRNEPPALQVILELLQRAGDNTHISEVSELLAHASVQSGDLATARDMYERLSTMEPENLLHTQNLQQVSSKMGQPATPGLITAEEAGVLIEELETTAPAVEQSYPEEIATAVRAALTDAELFVSYNMPAKALEPLTTVLPQAPEDIRLNQELVALHTRAGRFAEAAACCRILERAYVAANQQEHGSRYGNLATRLEACCAPAEATPTAEEAVAAASSPEPWPTSAPAEVETYFAPTESTETPVAPAEIREEAPAPTQEFDLSEEWEGTVSEEAPAPAPEPVASAEVHPPAEVTPSSEDLVAEAVDEVRFYLQHSMRLQALASMAKLESLTQDESLIATLRAEYESAFAPAPVSERQPAPAIETPAPEPVVQELVPTAAEQQAQPVEITAPVEDVRELETFTAEEPKDEPVPVPQPAPATAPAAANTSTLGEFVADLESALGEDFLRGAGDAAKPAPAAVTAAPVSAPAAPVSVPVPAVAAAAAASAAPAASATSAFSHQRADMASLLAPGIASSGPGSDLAQMFNDLKGELEEDTVSTSADEDPETHYNLGVAFREMGLLDEAIGELQKVCHLVERGHGFPHVMQTYTWLAQCFLDKGVPEAAIRWYQQALKVPSIDEDTRTALHYELASAYEGAQNRAEALTHFLQVYGTNIDYRDVAERIKALRS